MTEYTIGKNAQENWDLFDTAEPTDWWFHFDMFPGAHLYTKEISPEIAKEMAQTLKERSKYRKRKRVVVVYTQRKNLRKGESPGEVWFKNKKKCQYIKV
jgi:predicted ribosome quality control (RQC) complex YloA/Tae2 family protein